MCLANSKHYLLRIWDCFKLLFAFFSQDEDVFNERVRIANLQNSEIQSEAVVLKDLTKVCCVIFLLYVSLFLLQNIGVYTKHVKLAFSPPPSYLVPFQANVFNFESAYFY